ncbi:MAG: glycosyltransferase [Planctomycetota bacterium]|jgi:glycosyltransferase involved in cell wall biosynthesis
MSPSVTLVIPCYNEANRLQREPFLQALVDYESLSLLFVDDGSTDDTAAVLERLAEESPERISWCSAEVNGGKGEAVRRGMMQACQNGAALIGYWDADLATPFAELPLFVKEAERHPSVSGFLGSRVQMLGRVIDRNPLRHYLGRFVATLISNATGLIVYDSQCGAKLFRRTETLSSALSQPFLSRWLFDVELLLRLVHGEGRSPAELFREIPLECWRDVAGSKVKPSDIFPVLRDLYRIWRNASR